LSFGAVTIILPKANHFIVCAVSNNGNLQPKLSLTHYPASTISFIIFSTASSCSAFSCCMYFSGSGKGVFSHACKGVQLPIPLPLSTPTSSFCFYMPMVFFGKAQNASAHFSGVKYFPFYSIGIVAWQYT